jgi:hypothetical protein
MLVTRKEMVQRGAKIPSMWVIFTPLLLVAAVLIADIILLSLVNHRGFSDNPQPSGPLGAFSAALPIVSVIGFLMLIPASIYWIYKYCKGVEFVTGGKTSFSYGFGLFLLTSLFSVNFVWPGIIQEGFNRIVSEDTQNLNNVTSSIA